MNKEENKEPIGYKFDISINKPVLMKRCDNYYYAYPSITGWVFYRSRYLGERDKEIIDIDFNDWSHKVIDVLIDESKKLKNKNSNYKQALIDIRECCNYYGITPEENDNVTLRHILKDFLQIIDKAIGDDENDRNK